MKKTITTLLAFSICLLFVKASGNEGETRTATLTYDISTNDRINIQAKYTDLNVLVWDKQEVQVEAKVRFDGEMNDRMRKFLDTFEEEVKSNISIIGGELLIKTNLDEPNKFQLGSKHVGIIISFDEDELRLEYTVKMPARNPLIIKNSYRDLNMTGNFQEVEIDQYSGDLRAETIEEAKIKLKYGSAYFDKLTTADIELYEQKFTVNTIGELELSTKYSELTIKSLGPTEIESYESDFEIGTLTYLEGNLKYGKLEVTEMFEEGELATYEFDIDAKAIGQLKFESSKYGKLEAESIEKLGLYQSYEDEFELDYVGSLISRDTKYGGYKIGTLGKELELSGYEDHITIEDLGSNATIIDIDGKYIDVNMDISNRAFKLIADTKYGNIDIDRDSMKVTRYIKDGDQLEIEAASEIDGSNPVQITIRGYEMKLNFD